LPIHHGKSDPAGEPQSYHAAKHRSNEGAASFLDDLFVLRQESRRILPQSLKILDRTPQGPLEQAVKPEQTVNCTDNHVNF
jgi:hypothetical protein